MRESKHSLTCATFLIYVIKLIRGIVTQATCYKKAIRYNNTTDHCTGIYNETISMN